MVTKYGMSESLGPVAYGSDHDAVFLGRDFTSTQEYSETVAAEIDSEIRTIVENAFERCELILREHGDKLESVAQFLLEHEKMEEEEFLAVMEPDTAPSEEPKADAAPAGTAESAPEETETAPEQANGPEDN